MLHRARKHYLSFRISIQPNSYLLSLISSSLFSSLGQPCSHQLQLFGPRGIIVCQFLPQTFCPFLNVSHMVSGLRSNNRYHTNELRFQLDLQAATLVASIASTPKLSVVDLHSIIAQRNTLHIILIRGKGSDPEWDSSSRLIVAFTSAPEEEMWRRVEGKRFVQYVWRAAIVQLEPYIAVANTGGMSAIIQGQELELRSHRLSGNQRTSMRVDLVK